MQEQHNTNVNALGYVVLALTHRHITSTYFVSYKNYVSIHIIKILNYLDCMGFNENNILRLMTRLILNAEVAHVDILAIMCGAFLVCPIQASLALDPYFLWPRIHETLGTNRADVILLMAIRDQEKRANLDHLVA